MATKAAQDKIRKPLAFEVTEPRGNTVICAQSVFDSHIAKDHAEMAGRLDDIKAAIIDPDGIRESTARADAQIFEWIAADSVQVRAIVTFDDISLVSSGGTIAKVNSAFPVQPLDYDKPQVGNFVYSRPKAKAKKGGK